MLFLLLGSDNELLYFIILKSILQQFVSNTFTAGRWTGNRYFKTFAGDAKSFAEKFAKANRVGGLREQAGMLTGKRTERHFTRESKKGAGGCVGQKEMRYSLFL